MSPTAWGAITALTIFALTATFYAGTVTARLKAIEDWRLEVRADFLELRRTLDRVENLIRNGPE